MAAGRGLDPNAAGPGDTFVELVPRPPLLTLGQVSLAQSERRIPGPASDKAIVR